MFESSAMNGILNTSRCIHMYKGEQTVHKHNTLLKYNESCYITCRRLTSYVNISNHDFNEEEVKLTVRNFSVLSWQLWWDNTIFPRAMKHERSSTIYCRKAVIINLCLTKLYYLL